MGSLCSKPSDTEGGHTVLSSGPVKTNQQYTSGRPANSNTTGGSRGGPSSARPDPRAAAAEAAERRLQAQQKRGVNDANPKQGKLASQLAKQNGQKATAQAPEENRLVWD